MAKVLMQLTDELLNATAESKIYRLENSNVSSKSSLKRSVSNLRDDDDAIIVKFLCACIENASYDSIRILVKYVLTETPQIKWEEKISILAEMYQCIIDQRGKEEKRFKDNCKLDILIRDMNFIIKKNSLQKFLATYQIGVLMAAIDSLDVRRGNRFPIGQAADEILEDFTWREHSSEATSALGAVKKKLKLIPNLTGWNVSTAVVRSICSEKSTQFQKDINEATVNVFKLCMRCPWEYKSEKTNACKILQEIMNNYLCQSVSAKIVAPMIEDVKQIWESHNPELWSYADHVLENNCDKIDIIGSDYVEKLLDLVLSGEKTGYLSNLTKVYPKCPECFHRKFEELLYALKVSGSYEQSTFLCLFWEMAKQHPDVFSPKSVLVIVESLDDKNAVHMSLQVLLSLANYNPDEVYCHMEAIIQAADELGDGGFAAIQIIVAISRNNEERAVWSLQYIASRFDSKMSSTLHPTLIHYMRTIGVEWPDALAEYRGMLQELSRNPLLRDSCKAALDVIEGRSLENISNEVSKQQMNIETLDTRLAVTGDNLENIAKEMDARPKAKPRTSILNKDSNSQENVAHVLGQVLGKLSILDEIKEKMEAIEHYVVGMDGRLRRIERQVSSLVDTQSSNV